MLGVFRFITFCPSGEYCYLIFIFWFISEIHHPYIVHYRFSFSELSIYLLGCLHFSYWFEGNFKIFWIWIFLSLKIFKISFTRMKIVFSFCLLYLLTYGAYNFHVDLSFLIWFMPFFGGHRKFLPNCGGFLICQFC